ncbi:2-C-methyl-D-erythritol 2,4-cyclodiphosphate synthase [Neomoorella thermoacetica]|uniref:2-C-methyl-D-erythritol 2,4-cyclodiphosphate synthase n=3 Tax=Neomoorella thermoacetica TaxID=1525 RepID=ISPF_MOOTA|nr:2-C-methyl-D-erythritol 2,4-cyclodiphosphate synthase [Moorella thermoacetica]Q2RFM1.1 RecName: Full=2-C-methyl-D-erythritol 2,4-cyclodiphosphate synthase; Short=MECDP-synthase; Short=MECPP-synthase; Short=MECPS [Moorella thermoacetica ATCC 39073]AKX95347.1 2-C-methyl-D-erythritol 2,4-cyclodiphosphate synthase [Moorella thermoacetica]AKX97972.1 2-C-methyl-D-erythritol 2,4-cyclodiphosphate synthase [Moorella thermoacetica]AOQ25460.1 2-C-methyl-D-erythritol 2,4-cyclodiphosphate synthase [Moore
MRIGYGYDVHGLVPGRKLVLGGVTIPYDRGLAGHSDADVLLHALADALLGAAALGDIGHYFPPGDPRYKDADSMLLLREVYRHVQTAGYRLANADATITAQEPRLAPYIDAMRERIAAALGVTKEQISVKATTTEGLGFTGRGEGISAQAVVLLLDREAGAGL